MTISEIVVNKFHLSCDFLKKNKVFTLITALTNSILFLLGVISIYFGIQSGFMLITAISSISLIIILTSNILLLSWVIKNKLFKKNFSYKIPEKKEQGSQTDPLPKKQSLKGSILFPLNKAKSKVIDIKEKQILLSSKPKLDNKNIIQNNIDTLINKKWRIGLDQKQLLRYLYIAYPIGLFLSIRHGSLLSSHSGSPNRHFSIVIDINNSNYQEQNKLLSLIPPSYSQDLIQTSHDSFISIPYSNKSYPFLSNLICVKENYNIPSIENIPEERKAILQEALLNRLKMSYIKILSIAINLRIQTLQLIPLEIPFKMNEKTKENLNKLALLQAIDKITSENRSMDILQEIIIILNTKTNY